MDMYVKSFSPGYKIACVFDALLLPALFALWYRANYLGVTSTADGEVLHHPGLLVSAVMMIIAGRATRKIEKGLRTPWAYSFDAVLALRWYVVIILMGLSIRLLWR